MDPLTHTLIGANLANAFFTKKIGRAAVPIMCVAANLPDVDAIVMLTGDPMAITLRRTFGHSLLTLPLLVAGAAWLTRRKYPEVSYTWALWLFIVGAASHVFFDLVNSFGVRLLWPARPWRPELASVFIIDLALTGLLALPYVLPKADRVRWARVALCAVALYVNVCEYSRRQAGRLLAPLAHEAEFSYLFPEPLGPHRWRGVVRRGEKYSIFLIEPFARRVAGKGGALTELRRPQVAAARASEEGRRLEAFFKAPVWRMDESGLVRVHDLRFESLVIRRPAAFEYAFEGGRLARGI